MSPVDFHAVGQTRPWPRWSLRGRGGAELRAPPPGGKAWAREPAGAQRRSPCAPPSRGRRHRAGTVCLPRPEACARGREPSLTSGAASCPAVLAAPTGPPWGHWPGRPGACVVGSGLGLAATRAGAHSTRVFLPERRPLRPLRPLRPHRPRRPCWGTSLCSWAGWAAPPPSSFGSAPASPCCLGERRDCRRTRACTLTQGHAGSSAHRLTRSQHSHTCRLTLTRRHTQTQAQTRADTCRLADSHVHTDPRALAHVGSTNSRSDTDSHVHRLTCTDTWPHMHVDSHSQLHTQPPLTQILSHSLAHTPTLTQNTLR